MPNKSPIDFTVHCLVKNEDIWVKEALVSVLPFAKTILVFDTGSTDKTIEKIKSIASPKIILEERGPKTHLELVDLRKEMIKRTKTSWFLILDGDEVWPEDELLKLLEAAKLASKNIVALVNRNRNCVGDVFHYLPESSSRYNLAGRVGNLTIRMIRKSDDLTIGGEYPLESFTNSKGPIQSQEGNLEFIDCWYLHTSVLRRSSIDDSKKSGSYAKTKIWEKGIELKFDDLPEVLKKLDKNSAQLRRRGKMYEVASHFTTPVISLKRKLGR